MTSSTCDPSCHPGGDGKSRSGEAAVVSVAVVGLCAGLVEEDTTVKQPRRDPTLLRPDADYLVQLADAVIATLAVAEHDDDQRALMVVEAGELVERIQVGLVAIEDADPTWPGWGGLTPPRGTVRGRILDARLGKAPTVVAGSDASASPETMAATYPSART